MVTGLDEDFLHFIVSDVMVFDATIFDAAVFEDDFDESLGRVFRYCIAAS